jgi:hypothetical protein
MTELLLLAQLAQPVIKAGQCPLGYYTQGAYCTPARVSTPPAITGAGRCPYGWFGRDGYCVQAR